MAKKKIAKTSKRVLAKQAEKKNNPEFPQDKKLVLHVGCMNDARHDRLDNRFAGEGWFEVRVGFEPESSAKIQADPRTLTEFKNNQFDAVWFPGKIDRFHESEAVEVMQQLRRVLKDEGVMLLNIPNIKTVCETVYKHGLKYRLHKMGDHDITPMDLLFGFQPEVRSGSEFALHRVGFTPHGLLSLLKASGFKDCRVQADGLRLWGQAKKLQQNLASNPNGRVSGDDPNDMMKQRDALDIPPALPVKYSV